MRPFSQKKTNKQTKKQNKTTKTKTKTKQKKKQHEAAAWVGVVFKVRRWGRELVKSHFSQI